MQQESTQPDTVPADSVQEPQDTAPESGAQPEAVPTPAASEGQETVGVADAEAEIGLPQLRADDWGPQLVWLVIVFAALYFLLSRITLPRIAAVIEERRDKIADDLDQADAFKKEADEALEAYQASIAEARSKAVAIGADARAQMKAEAEERRRESEAHIAEMMNEAEQRITAAKEAALGNVRDIASETAAAIVEKLIGQTVDRDSVEAAVTAELDRSQG